MKIILSIDAIRFPLTGIGRYVFELARHLQQSPEIAQLQFMSGHRLVEALPEAASLSSTDSVRNSRIRKTILRSKLLVDIYSQVSPMVKRRVLSRHKDSVFHGPNYYLPPFTGKSVATIHDLSMFTCPEFHPPERVRYMRKEIARTLDRADLLITDTEYTRREVASYFALPLEKIHAIPLACAEEFRPRAAHEVSQVLAKYDLRYEGYSLYVGTIEPRKNLEVLLRAYALLPAAVRGQWPLILVGYQGWRSEAIHALLSAAQSEGWVRYLNFVTNDELATIYSGARLFVFPSLYEGFGLPVLEAMASGIPVVCSNSSTLPEVAGDAAAMCHPEDVEGLCGLIRSGLEDDHWREEAKRAGLARAATFSWARCAEQTVAAYREVL